MGGGGRRMGELGCWGLGNRNKKDFVESLLSAFPSPFPLPGGCKGIHKSGTVGDFHVTGLPGP